MGKKLIILSDLWGHANAAWLTQYTDVLHPYYDIKLYDSKTLAGIDKSLTDESIIHNCLVNGGIDQAVINLIAAEPESMSVLAFSIGGTIAWKAAMSGLRVEALIAISSTRLRYETAQPACDIMLCFGKSDPYKPDQAWFDQHKLIPYVFEGAGHDMYIDPAFAARICDRIILKFNSND